MWHTNHQNLVLIMRLKHIILFVSIVCCKSICFSQEDSTQLFNDYLKIIGFNHKIVAVDDTSIYFAKMLCDSLKIEGDNYEKALKIKNYIHKEFSPYGRRISLIETIQKKSGNCWDHARLSVFLLRYAGVPAKFAYEINLKKNVFWWGFKAKKEKSGLWGYKHNDHIWVLFFDGKQWQPFDSELDIIGINEFVTKRWGRISPYFGKILPYGPPFIIWEDIGYGLANMKSITQEIWNHKNNNDYTKVSKEEWYLFFNQFESFTYEFLNTNFFPKKFEILINNMHKKWF